MSDEAPIALLVTPVLPLPGGSGRALRAWDWLQELARSHRVHVLVAAPLPALPPLPPDYPAAEVRAVGGATTVTRRFRKMLGLLFPPAALLSHRFVLDWRAPAAGFADEAAGHLEGAQVDRIVVFRLYLHDLGRALSQRFGGAALELDLDDLESQTRRSIAASLLRGRRYRDAALMLSSGFQYGFIEWQALRHCRTIYLAAAEDCHRLADRVRGDVVCRPNRIPVPDNVPPPAAGELRLIFVGTLNYPPNEEAVRDLALKIVPALRRLDRPWRLVVAGSNASPGIVQMLRRTAGVEFIADGGSLSGLYAASHIVLVPLRAGGGTKFKTLEGFAHRRPVVSTRHGVRGLAAVAGEHYLPAETAEEFAAAILRLAADPSLAERIAEAGWQLCRTAYCVP